MLYRESSLLNPKFSSLNLMDMGDRIKHARLEAGLTQPALGKKIGVSKGAISQWENGNVNNLKMANLFAMEDATGFHARWLALDEGPQRLSSAAPTPEEFDARAELLDDSGLATILRLAADKLSPE